jgi:hypothetical protein
MKHNYTSNAWVGEKYQGYLPSAELAKLIRKDLKKAYPDCKFSVTKQDYSGGRSITVSVMATPFQVVEDWGNWSNNYAQLNQNYIESTCNGIGLTEEGIELLRDVVNTVQSYNYDDSDAQIDYFNCNFYSHFALGKWDKPYERRGKNVTK